MRNDWADQNNGSAVILASDGSFKITHRMWGENYLWVVTSAQNVNVKNGASYKVSFDFKDDPNFRISSIEVGFANGIIWSGPTGIGSTSVVPSGYSASSFTNKSVLVKSGFGGTAMLAVKLNWNGQPPLVVSDYIKNIKVCDASAAPIAMIPVEEAMSLKLYPNPAFEVVTVEFNKDISGSKVIVTDGFGAKILVPLSVSGNTIYLNTGVLDNGLYNFSLFTPQGISIN